MAAHFRRWALVLGCLAVVVLSRVPAMCCQYELNMDESQMAAQAMRYAHDLTPWRSVEGETNGPLDSWLLLAAHDVGMPYRFPALHALAALCLCVLLASTYAVARRLVGETAALVGLAAAAWWLAWAPIEDLTHYSSELVPAILISLGLAVVARTRAAPGGPGWRAGLLAGLLLGLAPWGKLQAGPVALLVGLWAIVDGGAHETAPADTRRRYVAALLAGAAVPSVGFLLWVYGAGAGEEFWRIYILGGLEHGHAQPWSEHLKNFGVVYFRSDDSPWFWGTTLLLAAACAWRGRREWRAALAPRIGLLAWLWLGAGLFVALRPVTQRTHYALFFVAPLLLVVAVLAQVLLGGARAASSRRMAWAILALGILPLPVYVFVHFRDYIGLRAIASSPRPFMYQPALSRAVRHFVPQPRSLAVWGWKPSLYVDLGLAPATRNAVCAFLTDGNPSQEFLRAKYMQDLEASAPQVVVDVEDFVYRDQRKTSVDTFPALASYLDRYYEVAGAVEARRSADYTLAVVVYQRRLTPRGPAAWSLGAPYAPHGP